MVQARVSILEVHARDKKMAPDADFHKVARATGGFSGAQLMNLMNVAAINAVQRGAAAVATDDMLTVILPPPSSRRLPGLTFVLGLKAPCSLLLVSKGQ